jgi:hypothetical protein
MNIGCALCGNEGPSYWIATRAEEGPDSCEPDLFEPNSGPNEAYILGTTGQALELPELRVCGQGDDWFIVDKERNRGARFIIEFIRQRGDIDLFLYTPNLELIDYDIDGLGAHAVTIDDSLPNGSYYIRVALFGGGTHTYRGRLEP